MLSYIFLNWMELILLQICSFILVVGGSVKGRQVLGKYPETFERESEEYPYILARGKVEMNHNPI